MEASQAAQDSTAAPSIAQTGSCCILVYGHGILWLRAVALPASRNCAHNHDCQSPWSARPAAL